MKNGFTLTEKEVNYAKALAYSFGKKNGLFPKGMEAEELVSVSLLALCEASDTYNSEKGAKFTTYAYVCIHHALSKTMTNFIKRTNMLENYPGSEDVENLECEAANDKIYNEVMTDVLFDLAADLVTEEYFKAKRRSKKVNRNLIKNIVRARIERSTSTEIAHKFGLSKTVVDNIFAETRRCAKASKEEILLQLF